MFSRREPVENDDGENERDVFNEKPSAEEVRAYVVLILCCSHLYARKVTMVVISEQFC